MKNLNGGGYLPLQIELIELNVEKGFADSTPAPANGEANLFNLINGSVI